MEFLLPPITKKLSNTAYICKKMRKRCGGLEKMSYLCDCKRR
jgi:hypothetical protein